MSKTAKWLISRIYKRFIHQQEKDRNPSKWVINKRQNQTGYTKHMLEYSNSLVIREIRMKDHWDFTLHLWQKLERWIIQLLAGTGDFSRSVFFFFFFKKKRNKLTLCHIIYSWLNIPKEFWYWPIWRQRKQYYHSLVCIDGKLDAVWEVTLEESIGKIWWNTMQLLEERD